jgi:hypothetical protein
MHAQVLPALGQRLDIVVHRVGQGGKPHDALGVGRTDERVQEGFAPAPLVSSPAVPETIRSFWTKSTP